MPEKLDLTVDEALALLPDGDEVHTFRNAPFGLVGTDWERPAIELAIQTSEGATLSGEMARSMGHGMALWVDGSWLFVATVPERLPPLVEAES